ncbi:uncharacterized protein CANTADRAFT_320653 [Suhomyces tanzawaensis NRRL Y-17324]|uniref:Uncharacterized protein n=1 Tax=Suhomyces tanzawaensis NRRL Y-17324 TaxID=984487 RepID=A0A1E4SBS1_9ASCO|nr:uncharacterized protein CANTADRAFT_320653 [Suhomyces tanzawaensis NRRL Y-17324]ODV76967.1 hypothetical protein CANTADRAFT_320653 [Suhomyces tanzawaensis NRRL Y-17324]
MEKVVLASSPNESSTNGLKMRLSHPSPSSLPANPQIVKEGYKPPQPPTSSPVSSKTSEEPLDVSIECLYAEVRLAVSPFASEQPSEPNQLGRAGKYFIWVSVFFPAMVAVMVPEAAWNSLGGMDLADLFSNLLLILLIGWSIKFSVEWPWKWLRHIRLVKQKLTLVINSPSGSEIASKVVLLRKVVYYECLALVACLLVPLSTSILMGWSRKHITVDDKRKKLVFNNINIILFQIWLVFRWLVTLADWQNTASYSKHAAEFPENSSSSDNSSTVKYLVNKFYTALLPIDLLTLQQQQRLAEKLASLELKSEEQRQAMDTILGSQEEEYSTIVNYLSKLEKTILSLVQNTKNSPKVDSGVFVKPFPLNLKSEANNGKHSMDQKIQALGIITEVDYSSTPSPRSSAIASPTFSAFQPSSLQSPFPESGKRYSSFEHRNVAPQNSPASKYSLHGVSSTLSMLNLLARELDYSDSHDEEIDLSQLPSAIDSQVNSGVLIVKELRDFAATLRERITFIQIVRHPWMVAKLVLDELQYQLLRSQQHNVAALQQLANLYKLVVWNLINHYLFRNIHSISLFVIHAHTAVVTGVLRIMGFMILMSVQVPINATRLWINIHLFIPRILFRFCVVYPAQVVKSKLSPAEVVPVRIKATPVHSRSSSVVKTPHLLSQGQHKGMKKFRLSPSSEYPAVGNDYFDTSTSLKSQGKLLHKWTHHLDMDPEAHRPSRPIRHRIVAPADRHQPSGFSGYSKCVS